METEWIARSSETPTPKGGNVWGSHGLEPSPRRSSTLPILDAPEMACSSSNRAGWGSRSSVNHEVEGGVQEPSASGDARISEKVESVVTTTLRDEARRWASGVGHRRMSLRVPAALLCSPPHLWEPEVMRTSIDEASVAAAPAADARKQERARRRLHQASERRASHEADGRCTSV